MGARIYATVGRSSDCDVVLDHPTVSSHHVRISWAGASLLVEDLASANGTFVDDKRIRTARVRPGAEIRCGAAVLPWSHEGLRAVLRAGAGQARTLAMPKMGAGAYVCGACGHLGELAQKKAPPRIRCEKCGAVLRARSAAGSRWGLWAGLGVLVVAAGGAASVLLPLWSEAHGGSIGPTSVPPRASADEPDAPPVEDAPTPSRVAKALTPMDPVTRNAAARIAARSEGAFHVEQMAEIWSAVRRQWRYVNDPHGRDYFASARETIENGYVGDCDDFAIVLASMVTAVGGEARIVLMDGPGGGHAYAEGCVHGEPTAVARSLGRHYRTRWRTYLAGGVPRTISYRRSPACPLWLNLDWNASVPGGPYQPETTAVAIYEDGRSESLAPAQATQ